MAHYDIFHGGAPRTWPNVGFAAFPSKDVGPYEFEQASAHFRPTTFTINRYLWFGNPNGYFRDLDAEANASPALKQWLRNLRSEGREVAVGDTLQVIGLPVDSVFQRFFVRNMTESPGFTVGFELWDKDNTIIHNFGSFDLTAPHLDRTQTMPPVYTEGFIRPMVVPSQNQLDAADALADAEQAVADAEQAVADAEQAVADAEAAVVDPANPTPAEQAAIDAAQDALAAEQAALATAQDVLAEARAGSVAASGDNGYYMGHNHKLIMRIMAMPDDQTIDYVKLQLAAEVNDPWLGAW